MLVTLAPSVDVDRDFVAEDRAAAAAKLSKLRATEDAVSAGSTAQDQEAAVGLAQKVMDNLQVVVKRVHIRVEDRTSVPGSTLAAGLFIQELALQSVDADGKPAFLVDPVHMRKVGGVACAALCPTR